LVTLKREKPTKKAAKKQPSTETLVSESEDSEPDESEQESDDSKPETPRRSRVKNRAKSASSVKKSRGVDLSLSGICLKRFYAPQFAAVNKLKNSEITPNVAGGKSFDHLWAYPVPNPQVWK
jgi:hypothetical protein